MPSPTESYSEKYLKRLAGSTDLEDALKKLDNLTQEEARMAVAQSLKAAYTNDVDQLKRSSSRNCIHLDIQDHAFSHREPIITRPF